MNRQKFNAALAVSEKYGVVVKREAVVSMPRVCAKHNRHYTAIYIALRNGRYRFKECIAAVQGSSGHAPEATSPLENIDVSLIEFSLFHREKCPWCGSGQVCKCNSCNQYVCSGRVKDDAFQCCDSCGFVGVLAGTYTSLTGSKHNPAPALKAPSSAAGALRAPVGNGLKLSSGGKK